MKSSPETNTRQQTLSSQQLFSSLVAVAAARKKFVGPSTQIRHKLSVSNMTYFQNRNFAQLEMLLNLQMLKIFTPDIAKFPTITDCNQTK